MAGRIDYFVRPEHTYRTKKPQLPTSNTELESSVPEATPKKKKSEITKRPRPWSKEHEDGELKFVLSPHKRGKFSNKRAFIPHRDLNPNGSPKIYPGDSKNLEHSHQPDRHYRDAWTRDYSSELTVLKRERAHRRASRDAIRDALLGEEEFESALIDEKIVQEKLATLSDDDGAWEDWQSGERFDGAQKDEYIEGDDFEDDASRKENAELQRILAAERMFEAGKNWRRPQGTGRVRAITGNTNKPVPGKTPGFSYKE